MSSEEMTKNVQKLDELENLLCQARDEAEVSAITEWPAKTGNHDKIHQVKFRISQVLSKVREK